MANQERKPFVLDFPNGQRVEDILKKADANYSKAEIDQQMAGKATMSDVQRETQSLQNQINEIVRAPESGGDVGAEVYQARVGADGTSYQTLKERLDTEYTEQAEALIKRQPISLRGYNNLLYNAEIHPNAFYLNGTAVPESQYCWFALELSAGTTYYFGEGTRGICGESGPWLGENISTYTPDTSGTYYITFRKISYTWKVSTESDLSTVPPYQYLDYLQHELDTTNTLITALKNDKQPISLRGYDNLLYSAELHRNAYYKDGTPTPMPAYCFFKIELTAGTTYYFGEGTRGICAETGSWLAEDISTFTPDTSGTYYVTFRNINDAWVVSDKDNIDNIAPYQYLDYLQNRIKDINQEISTLNSFIRTSDNILTDCSVVSGFYSYKHFDSTDYKYFRQVPVTSGTTYHFNFTARLVAFLDTNKEYVTHTENVIDFTAASDGYINVTIRLATDDVDKAKGVQDGVSFDSVPPYGWEITSKLLANDLSKAAKDSVWPTDNLFNASTLTQGYINANGSIIVTDSYYTTDYIPVTVGTGYLISRFRKFLAYNNAKQIIADSFIDGWNQDYVFTASQNGYIRFSLGSTHLASTHITSITPDIANVKIPEGVALSQSLLRTVRTVFTEERVYGDPLAGRKWCVIGDSFSFGGYSPMNTFDSGVYAGFRKVYPYYIGNRTAINIVDFTAGGRTLAFPAVPGDFTNSITCPTANCYYQNIPADTELLTIYLGINDSHHASGGGDGEDPTGYIPLGTIDDTTTASFGGAWNVVLSWLITNRPNTHIGIIVSNGCDSDDYRTLTIAIAHKYGIPYIDLNGDQVTPAMIRTTNPDIPKVVKQALVAKWRVGEGNSHPNDAAHEFESYVIESFLRRL